MIFLFCLFVFSTDICAQTGSSPPAADKAMLLWAEAVSKIIDKSLDDLTAEEIARESLKAYLKNKDPYSDYLSPEEYRGFKASQEADYAGVGMEIERNAEGNILCFPYPGGPAERYGIKSGDILTAVEEISVSGKSVFTIGTMVRGKEGTEISLTVQDKTGKSRQIRVKRASVQTESVTKKRMDSLTVVQILSFGKSTQRELKYALMNANETEPVVIDLRGNPGGDLHSAIDSAMLFLEHDKKIVDIAKKNESKSYKSSGTDANFRFPLYLWQDEMTASAAEVFIAALTQNKRAVSIGKKTYGKGIAQEIAELSDGSAIFLTAAYLQTPDGTRYHGRGLQPDYVIDTDSPRTKDYLAKVKDLNRNPSLPNPDEKQDVSSAVSPKPIPGMAVSAQQNEKHFICFDRDFDTEEKADIWAEEIRNTLNRVKDQYLLQRNTSGKVKFVVCLGPYENRESADREKDQISKLMNTAMFTEILKAEEVKSAESEDSEKTADTQPAQNAAHSAKNGNQNRLSGVFFIQTVSLSDREAALSAQSNLADKFRKAGMGATVHMVAEKGKYRILIGPYNQKDDVFLNKLKEKNIVERDALWIQQN